MYFGAHVSISGGVFNAPLNAAAIGCEVFQMFSRSPRGGNPPPLTKTVINLFKTNMALCGQRACVIHTPYFIHLASANNRVRYGSIKVLREELERGTLLGAQFVMSHLGSYNDFGEKIGFIKVVEGLQKVLNGYRGSTQFLIEISAGAGNVIGGTFEQVAEIIHHPKLRAFNIGVCYDTQHAFASGYDIRTPAAVTKTFKLFDQTIGLKNLQMFHCNDSLVEFNSHKDRHAHIGEGYIGHKGFEALLSHPAVRNKNFYLETEPEKVKKDLQILKEIRAKFIL